MKHLTVKFENESKFIKITNPHYHACTVAYVFECFKYRS